MRPDADDKGAATDAGRQETRRPLRRADWVATRRRIIDAAAEEFSRRGYRRSSTLDLASAAGVAEATVFRHFPTKARLFEQSVIAPLHDAVAMLAERRRNHPDPVSNELASFTFYDEILGWMRKHSRLIIAALATLTFEEETTEFAGLTAAFSELLAYMDEVFTSSAAQRHFEVDSFIGPRVMLSTTLGLALCDRLLFQPGQQPEHEQLVTQLAKLTAYGLLGRPPMDDPNNLRH